MADEEQAVYEQYPPFKDVRGVNNYFNIYIYIYFIFYLNSYW